MSKISIDDFTKYKFISTIKHSPDGKYACFAVHQANLAGNDYRSNLWLLNLATEHYFQLTASDAVKDFIWLDNQTILFPAVREPQDSQAAEAGEEFTLYYKINIHGGEAVKAFKAPVNVSAIRQLNTDSYLVLSEYNANQSRLHQLSQTGVTAALQSRNEEKDYEVLEEIPFWSNGAGFTSKRRQRLYLYNAVFETLEPVTGEYTNVELFNLNPANTEVVMIASHSTGKLAVTNELYVYDMQKKAIRQISQPESMRHEYADYLDDNTIIYTAAGMQAYGLNENQKFYIAAEGRSRCITPELDLSITNTVGSDCRFGGLSREQVDGNQLYFVATEGGDSFLNRINSRGKLETLTAGSGSVDGLSVCQGSILFIGMRSSRLQEIYKLQHSGETQLTFMNEWVQTERSLSYPEKLSVETEPGITVDGWLMKPAGFAAGKKYPAILAIHGGPKAAYGAVFFHDLQYLAAEGYVVFFCNPRGSDGKGDSFADIRGKYGTIDYNDIMEFTDAVIEKFSCIDQGRLGVIGGSYGGFMTNWIIGHTDRFRAAVSERSIANWISMFCTTDIGYYFVADQISATPWNKPGQLWEYSPLKYADRVTTPTLFLQAEEDYRCWLAEGLQMFTALKFHGVDSRLCLFRGENHDLGRNGKPNHRLRRLREIISWFDRYLK